MKPLFLLLIILISLPAFAGVSDAELLPQKGAETTQPTAGNPSSMASRSGDPLTHREPPT